MKRTISIALTGFVLGLLVAGYLFLHHAEQAAPAPVAPAGPAPSLSSSLYAEPSPEVRTNQDFVTISEKVGPAVLRIDAEHREQRMSFGFPEGSPFDDFWNRFFDRPTPRQQQEVPVTAQGTGFFISPDGYILTNNHIVEKAVKVTVYSISGQEYQAKVIGTDPRTDIALIKIEAKNQPFVELGDSAQVKVGEWVLAIGNPLGMEHTVTAGIVSAKGRQLETGSYQDFIQTDAAINRGNSGGPLINMRAEVIGITSNILTPTGGNIGIGFAIPSNIAKRVVDQLKEKGRVVRGYLGIYPTGVTEGMVKQFKLSSRKGAVVASVEEGGPADKAGIKQYDVIVAINGQAVENETDLRFKIADVQPGQKATIKIIRDGKEMTLTATVEELETGEEAGTTPSTDKDIGLSVTPLTAGLARRYGLRTTEGLVITQVREYSEAARKGLEAGMVILEVNRKKVATVRDFEAILKNTASGDEVILLVRIETDGRSQETIVTLRVP